MITAAEANQMALKVIIDAELKNKLPSLKLLVVEMDLSVIAEALGASAAMEMAEKGLAALSRHVEAIGLKRDKISEQPEIQAGRKAYRTLGKDPTRYRLSSEKLLRRYLGDEGFPFCQQPGGALVDLFNFLSLRFMCPVGAIDRDCLEGNTVVVDCGRQGEGYETLSGLYLNLEGLLVSRDARGAFGSTTADSYRSGISGSTQRVQAILFFFEERWQSRAVEAILLLQMLIDVLDPGCSVRYQQLEAKGHEEQLQRRFDKL